MELGQEDLKRAICRIVLLRCPSESCLNFSIRAPCKRTALGLVLNIRWKHQAAAPAPEKPCSPASPARRLNSRQRRSKRRLEEFLEKKRISNSKASEVVARPIIDEQLNANPAGRNSTSISTSVRNTWNCPVGEIDERMSPSPNLPKAKDRRQAPEAQRMADSQASAITAAGNDPRPQTEADQPKFPFLERSLPNPSLATLAQQIREIDQFINQRIISMSRSLPS